MKLFALSLVAAALLNSPVWSAEAPLAESAAPTPEKASVSKPAKIKVAAPVPVESATPVAVEPLAAAKVKPLAAFDESFGHFALGVGYPDVRMRLALGYGFAADAKLATDGGIQVYTGRVSYNFWQTDALKLMVAGELGLANISNVETVTANGGLAGLAVGFEYPFAKVMRVSLDAGPVWLGASNAIAGFSKADIVFNTALYFYLF